MGTGIHFRLHQPQQAGEQVAPHRLFEQMARQRLTELQLTPVSTTKHPRQPNRSAIGLTAYPLFYVFCLCLLLSYIVLQQILKFLLR